MYRFDKPKDNVVVIYKDNKIVTTYNTKKISVHMELYVFSNTCRFLNNLLYKPSINTITLIIDLYIAELSNNES